MKKEYVKQTADLNDLVRLIRTPGINKQNRAKVNTLIIMDVHARDIVGRFVRDSILDKKEFDWES
jgi:dynein heavy chain